MIFFLASAGIALGLFLGMLLFLEFGRRLGAKRAVARGAEAQAGVGVVEGAVYGLLALLVGFMFSGAAARFDNRRELVAKEKNAASTAWMRVSLLPADQQPGIRAAFRHYMDELIAYYAQTSSAHVLLDQTPSLRRAEKELWANAVRECTEPGNADRECQLLLPALNDMFEAVDMERMSRLIHPPFIIFIMLSVAAMATALFAGYGMASSRARNWIYTIGIAATISIATWVIIELEFPRVGSFRVNAMDQVLVELRASME